MTVMLLKSTEMIQAALALLLCSKMWLMLWRSQQKLLRAGSAARLRERESEHGCFHSASFAPFSGSLAWVGSFTQLVLAPLSMRLIAFATTARLKRALQAWRRSP